MGVFKATATMVKGHLSTPTDRNIPEPSSRVNRTDKALICTGTAVFIPVNSIMVRKTGRDISGLPEVMNTQAILSTVHYPVKAS